MTVEELDTGDPRAQALERAILESGDPILKYFRFAHLSPPLSRLSSQFAYLAVHIVNTIERNPERSVALRKLLEAKDAAVRAALP